MREIKLRAWDDVRKEMLYSKVEQFDDSLLFRFDKHFETEKPIYMQSTGLKDKNGVEIYEGDVYQNKNGVIWVIYYDDNTASFVADALNRGYKKIHFLDKPDGIVIGNIHDNPDLLGDGHERN